MSDDNKQDSKDEKESLLSPHDAATVEILDQMLEVRRLLAKSKMELQEVLEILRGLRAELDRR